MLLDRSSAAPLGKSGSTYPLSPFKVCGPRMSRWLGGLANPLQATFRPAIQWRSFVHKASGLGTFHMTLLPAFAILLCSRRFRPPSGFHKTLAQTYDDVPGGCLINHWSTKYTRRLQTLSKFAVWWVIVIAPYSDTPTLRRCSHSKWQRRTHRLLAALGF